MVTPCPAPNAQSLSHVSMSEKTSGGCVGQCLGTSAVAMQGPAICSAASFHQAALAEPPRAPAALLSLTASVVVLRVLCFAFAKTGSAVVTGMDPTTASLCM